MASQRLLDVRAGRLQKADELRAAGHAPYPSRSGRSHMVADVLDGDLEGTDEVVTVCGRLMSWRKHGGLSFGQLQDQTGTIQLFVQKKVLDAGGEGASLGYAQLKLLDVGDIVEARGTVVRTQKGELSVSPRAVRVLCKSLRPLPDKWKGLQDPEARLRRRYLDTTMDPSRREPFAAFSRMLHAIRGLLHEEGFLEFHTPILQPQYGGGTARPFRTRVRALGCDFFLAISHELYLKRLITAGYDKVFTIGRYFRNEGIDRSHSPEFSMLETMTAYENYEYGMDLVERLFQRVADETFGRSTFRVGGHDVDVSTRWRRVSMVDVVRETTGHDFSADLSLEQALGALAASGIDEAPPSVGHALATLYEDVAQPRLVQPTLVYGHPMAISPLAKPMDDDPRWAERFEIVIGGIECGDNWSEQNDPVELLARWEESRRLVPDDEEQHPLDYDFLEVLEHGMPPTTGIGPGLERMAMTFLETENIDEVVFFPLMRPRVSDANRQVYGLEAEAAAVTGPGRVPMTLDQLVAALRDGVVAPTGRAVRLVPVVQRLGTSGGARRFGAVDVDGLGPGGVRLVGWDESVATGADREGGAGESSPGEGAATEAPGEEEAPASGDGAAPAGADGDAGAVQRLLDAVRPPLEDALAAHRGLVVEVEVAPRS